MPSDIVGTEVIEEDRATGKRVIRFIRGPIFANIILADEINRTPPKTQAALLEAMQEYQVTVSGVRFELERPLFVLATQNPIEQEGTYPLPEAQLDRFMFNVVIEYPIAGGRTAHPRADDRHGRNRTISRRRHRRGDRAAARGSCAKCRRPRTSIDYAHAARARDPTDGRRRRWRARLRAPVGALGRRPAGRAGAAARREGTRAARGAAASWRSTTSRAVALPVLRHRVLLNFQAEADGIGADDVVRRLLGAVRPR